MSVDVSSLAAAGRAAFVPEYDPEETVPKPPPPRRELPAAPMVSPLLERAFGFSGSLAAELARQKAEAEPDPEVLTGTEPDDDDPPIGLLQMAPLYAGGILPDGVWQRVPLGASGTVLTSNGLSMGWALPGAASGVQPSGDVTGATDTAAIKAALASSNVLVLGVGTFYTNSPILIPPQAMVSGSGALTRIFPVATGDCLQFYGGVKPPGFGNIPNGSLAGNLSNLTIDGSLTPATAVSTGLHMGSGMGFSVDNVFVTNFASTPNSLGVHIDNNGQVSPPPFYTEKAHIRVYTANCGVHLMLDAAGASSPSMEYDDITVYLLWVEQQQVGVLIKDGAFMAGASLTIRGNFDSTNSFFSTQAGTGSIGGTLANIATWSNPAPGQLALSSSGGAATAGTALVPTSTGYGLVSYTGITGNNLTGCQYIGGSPAGTVQSVTPLTSGGGVLEILSAPTGNTSILQDVTIDLGVEVNNSRSNGPYTVFFGQDTTGGSNTPNEMINCSGRMAFRQSPWSSSNASAGGQVSFAGPIRNESSLAGANTWLCNGSFDVATPGQGLQVKEGSNCKQGTATLAAGTVVVANTSVTASSRILLTTNTPGGTPGWLQVSARTAGTSFTILSSSNTDTSVVAYQIFEPG